LIRLIARLSAEERQGESYSAAPSRSRRLRQLRAAFASKKAIFTAA
jgi:hypothetical protein